MSVLRKFAAAGLTAGTLSMVACFDETTSSSESSSSTMGGDQNKVLSTKVDTTLTLARFSQSCDSAGGLIEIHASCGGTNSCKGLSFNKWSHKLTEHTCKAANTCGGFSCITLPKDAGKTGAEVYSAHCADCHGDAAKGFGVYMPEGSDSSLAPALLADIKDQEMTTLLAFGITGTTPSGGHYSSMPGYREKLSVKELQRVGQYIRTLTPRAEFFEEYK